MAVKLCPPDTATGSWRVPPQLTQWRDGERAHAFFAEDADARQCPHDAVERVRIRCHCQGQLADRPSPIGELVGHAQPRGAVERLRDHKAAHEREQWVGIAGRRRGRSGVPRTQSGLRCTGWMLER
jgi:hypothetical protein